jgi:hypothetical protein
LPILVSGLNDNWSAFLYDRTLKAARPLGVFENTAWATVVVAGKADLFVGHPVVCDNTNVVLQVTQTGDRQWNVEVHNPTDAALRVTVAPNVGFDPFQDRVPATVELAPGSSKTLSW